MCSTISIMKWSGVLDSTALNFKPTPSVHRSSLKRKISGWKTGRSNPHVIMNLHVLSPKVVGLNAVELLLKIKMSHP